MANLYPARAIAAACLYDTLQRRQVGLSGPVDDWLDEVTGGKVEREDFDEILAELTNLRDGRIHA